jgi:hypothetical protein
MPELKRRQLSKFAAALNGLPAIRACMVVIPDKYQAKVPQAALSIFIGVRTDAFAPVEVEFVFDVVGTKDSFIATAPVSLDARWRRRRNLICSMRR